jgi:hypothetical protein
MSTGRLKFVHTLSEIINISFIKVAPGCQYKMTVHMTNSLNNNTVPLTVHMHTPHTDDCTCNVRTDEVPRDLTALNRDALDSSPL